MIQSGVQAQRTARRNTICKKAAAEASKNEEIAAAAMAQNNTEKANENSRNAKETRTKAFLWVRKEKQKNTMHEAMPSTQTVCQVIEVLKTMKARQGFM
jgi:hypothetical protein